MYYKQIIFIYAIIVIILHVVPTGSGVADSQTELERLTARNLLHMTIFIPWMILVGLHLDRQKVAGTERFHRATRWFITGLLLAVISECIQLYLPHRSFNIMDMLSNVTGVILGSTMFLVKK